MNYFDCHVDTLTAITKPGKHSEQTAERWI